MRPSSPQKLVHSPTRKNPLLVFSFLRISWFNSPSCREQSFLLKALWTWAMRSAVFLMAPVWTPLPHHSLIVYLAWPVWLHRTWYSLTVIMSTDFSFLLLFFFSNLNLRKCHFPTFRTYNFRTRVFLNHGKQEACPSLHSGVLPHNRRLRISSTQPSNSRLDQRTVSGIWSCSWRACLHTSCYTQSHRNLW